MISASREIRWLISTQLIIQLVTQQKSEKSAVFDFISTIFFTTNATPVIIVALSKNLKKRASSNQKAAKNINAWHRAADFSPVFMKFIFKNNFFIVDNSTKPIMEKSVKIFYGGELVNAKKEKFTRLTAFID